MFRLPGAVLAVLIVAVTFVAALVLAGPPAAGRGEASPADARQAVEEYLKEIEGIERAADQAKAGARKRLLDKLGQARPTEDGEPGPGLIGTAVVEGKASGIAYHYRHARVFPADLIRCRFHKADVPLPSVVITLVGYVDVPREMVVHVWHGAGGVSADHGELHVGGRLLGKVGDDLAKSVVYVVKLPRGRHTVRWVLTGGVFQNNYLKFEDPQTGQALSVCHDAAQRRQSGADRAREVVEANTAPSEWSKIADPREWHRQRLEWSPRD